MSQVDEYRNNLNHPISTIDRSNLKPPAKKNSTVKQVTIPDLGERTLNDPCYLMSSADTLKLANYSESILSSARLLGKLNKFPHIKSGCLEKKHLSEELLKPFIDEALAFGWGEVRLVGKQLLFVARFAAPALSPQNQTERRW